MTPKTFFVQNLGCAKNKCDGDKIAEFMVQKGLEESPTARKADLIVLNTCGFIESSREESIEEFFTLTRLKKKSAKIVFAGCMAQRYYSQLSSQLKEADYILGNWDIKEIENIIDDISEKKGKRVHGINPDEKSEASCYSAMHKIYSNTTPKGASVYIKVAEGCTHRCTFCAIPLIRGTLVSLPKEDVIQNAKAAISTGARELNLVAQDLINYGKDRKGKTELYSLLDEMCALSGDFVIRLLYIHPDFFETELVQYVKSQNGKILPYYDIPLQHASKNVLAKMGRRGDGETYARLLEKIRSIDEKSIIRSTFMLGFPEESDNDIHLLENFISQGILDYAGFFIFSPEEGTKAFEMGESLHTKSFYKKKLEKLISIQEGITDKRFARFVATEQNALIEAQVDDENYIARLWFQAPDVDGITIFPKKKEHKIGDVVRLRIISNDAFDFTAEEI